MDKAALWIGYVTMIGGGAAAAFLFVCLAIDGAFRAWRAARGFFDIVAAFEALQEKKLAASTAVCGVRACPRHEWEMHEPGRYVCAVCGIEGRRTEGGTGPIMPTTSGVREGGNGL
jgi:hypothetical protein